MGCFKFFFCFYTDVKIKLINPYDVLVIECYKWQNWKSVKVSILWRL